METKDPKNTLLFPEQVTIKPAYSSDKTSEEFENHLGTVGRSRFHTTELTRRSLGGREKITAWDEHGLLRDKYDADPSSKKVDERCHRHVLSMSFASGAVSTSDIPTHDKGCETFKQTDSYRLARGQYYVDTTPGNDADKPIKPNK